MRPRKRVVVVGGTETEQSILAMVLDTRGYAVEMAANVAVLPPIEAPHVFVVVEDAGYAEAAQAELRSAFPTAETVVVSTEIEKLLERVHWAAAIAARRRQGRPLHRAAKASAAGEQLRAEKNRRRLG